LSENPSIQELTRLVMFSGRISEVHLDNLRSFPWIFFNKLTEAKLEYDVQTTDLTKTTTFCYELKLPIEANDHLDKRYRALESAIRSLFWKEAVVQVKINGEEVYKSE